jgi:hypothetical protein
MYKKQKWILYFFVFNVIATFNTIYVRILFETNQDYAKMISNINTLIVSSFYAIYLYHNLYIHTIKKVVAYLGFALLFFWIFWYVILGNLYIFNNIIFAAFSIYVVLVSYLVLYQILINSFEEDIPNQSSTLWITCGIIIFFSAVTLCFALQPYIYKHQLKINNTLLYKLVPRYTCTALYVCILIGLSKWKKIA